MGYIERKCHFSSFKLSNKILYRLPFIIIMKKRYFIFLILVLAITTLLGLLYVFFSFRSESMVFIRNGLDDDVIIDGFAINGNKLTKPLVSIPRGAHGFSDVPVVEGRNVYEIEFIVSNGQLRKRAGCEFVVMARFCVLEARITPAGELNCNECEHD